ncbi:MAG TPA: flagellar hook-basal body complex protein FliE [Burkholderiaceae bacterium]|nr:flagellar hook-basal body complex protein FliE [Burkholderiaceae bacterium]
MPLAAPVNLAPAPDASAIASLAETLKLPQTHAAGEGLFDQLVSSLGEIDAGFDRSSRAATELALGQTDNLHQVMISSERTRLQFEVAMSMRNRVLEAYQEIMRMQV